MFTVFLPRGRSCGKGREKKLQLKHVTIFRVLLLVYPNVLYRKLTSVFKVYTLCWDRRETDPPLENMGKVQSNMDKAHITTKVAGKQVLRVLSPDRKNTGRKTKA